MAGERDGDWQDLNAHVDGELDAARQARMAGRIANDRDLARSAAVLARLRAETANAFLEEAAEIRSPVLSGHRPASSRTLPYRLLAAAIFLAVLAGIALHAVRRPGADPAVEAHLRWVETPPAATETLVSARHPAFPSEVPSLDAAGLRMVRATMEGEALHLGYLGPRGCRVSLWISPGKRDGAFMLESKGSLLIARWSAHGFMHAVLADGMPAARFSRIAAALHEASVNPAAPAARLAESGVREPEARCLG